MTRHRRSEQGFSLLEVVVALALTALFFSAMLPATGASLERLADTETRARALAIARSTLAKHAAIARFEDGAFEGRQGDFCWRTSISQVRHPAQPASPTSGPAGSFALRQVQVEVSTVVDAQPVIALSTYALGEVR